MQATTQAARPPAPASYWKTRAKQAVQAGYLAKNQWERDLKRHLERCFPELLKELQAGGEVNAYLIVKTSSAMDLMHFLVNQGGSPEDARQAARERLLCRPPEEEDRNQEWESQTGEDSAAGVASQILLPKNPSPPLPSKTTRPT